MSIKDFYEKKALEGAHMSPPIQQKILEEYLRRIKPLVSSKCVTTLDIGSGLGLNIRTLSRYSTQITAADVSSKALEISKKNNRKIIKKVNLTFVVSDVQKMQFVDESFDLVVCTEVLEHVRDLDKAVNEINRVLKVGGYLITSTPNYNNLLGFYKKYKDAEAGREYWEPWGVHKDGFERFMTPDLLEKSLKKVNFKLLQANGASYIYAWLYFSIFKRFNGRFPLAGLGKLPLLKKMGLEYYLLAQKEK